VTGAVLAALLAALLATLIVEESMGLSRWGAIRLAHWTARHIYAADPEQAATQAEEWEERIKEAIPSHILALCFALWLVGGALARIATPNARATTGKTPEGRSPMTMRRHAEVIMRWAARREYPDRPERAETRAEEWAHDMRQAAERGLLRALATGLPHVFSALRGPAHRRQRLGIDGDELMVAFEGGEIGADLLTESVRALIRRAGQSGWRGPKAFEPIRCAAVDRLSAERVAQFAAVLLTAGMPGEAATIVQA
jgi:hypothetical protein